MSYFSQPKNERDNKVATLGEAKSAGASVPLKAASEQSSIIGAGMLITGNIVCSGSVQVFGRVVGDIHVAQLVVCEGAYVEGKVMAQDAAISGAFKGTIHGNNVKLNNTAIVDGEIYKQSLTIAENAQFEGMSRRLEKPVEPPSSALIRGETAKAPFAAGSTGNVVPMPSTLA